MKYYITWAVDGASLLTVLDGEIELTVDQMMDAAFEVEEVEAGTRYEVQSVIRARDASVIV
jgi:hypothetical protein